MHEDPRRRVQGQRCKNGARKRPAESGGAVQHWVSRPGGGRWSRATVGEQGIEHGGDAGAEVHQGEQPAAHEALTPRERKRLGSQDSAAVRSRVLCRPMNAANLPGEHRPVQRPPPRGSNPPGGNVADGIPRWERTETEVE